MAGPVSYHEDVFAWSRQQAAVLRRLGARRDLPNDLDLDQIAGEIEDLGSEKLEAAASLLGNMLVHLLKLASLPDQADPANHWRREIRTWQRQVLLKYRPSMRQHLDLERLWQLARRDAAADLADQGQVLIGTPAACPFGLDPLLAEEFAVAALVLRLRAAADPGLR